MGWWRFLSLICACIKSALLREWEAHAIGRETVNSLSICQFSLYLQGWIDRLIRLCIKLNIDLFSPHFPSMKIFPLMKICHFFWSGLFLNLLWFCEDFMVFFFFFGKLVKICRKNGEGRNGELRGWRNCRKDEMSIHDRENERERERSGERSAWESILESSHYPRSIYWFPCLFT